ncbi:MAG: hypothetical protein ACMXX9_04585 [Candidatus Woesearchaeota archaeon]
MKRILVILFVLFLTTPLVYAQEVRDTEIRSMETLTGIEVRFMQLERAIYFNELRAERVLNYITETHLQSDVSTLESLLTELTLIRERASNVDFSKDRQDLVELYADLRRTANQISVEFRSEAHLILSEQERAELRSSNTLVEDRQKLQEYNQLVAQRLREHNARMYEARASQAGTSLDRSQRIREGELSAQEIRRELAESIRNKEVEERRRVEQELLEERTRLAEERRLLAQRIAQTQERPAELRDQVTVEAQRIREQNIQTRPSTNMYRVQLSQGESHMDGRITFTLRSLNQRQATFDVEGRQLTININERQVIEPFSVMYYRYVDESGVFVILNQLTSTEQRPVAEDQTRPDPQREEIRPAVQETTRDTDTNDRDTSTTDREQIRGETR